jgi:hypothetical protein
MDLSKLKYNRKPVTFEDVSNEVHFDKVKEAITDDLAFRDSMDLWGLKKDPKHPFSKIILSADTLDQYFVYINSDGFEFLINTEGYNYMRYAIRVTYGPDA